MTYCAYISDTEDSVIYKVTNNFVLEKEYTIKGWHRSFYISPNGQFVVIGYWGLNLVPLSITKDEVMVSIYKNGVLTHTINLGQIMSSMDSLQRTASHYHWGSINFVSDYDVYLKTIEGNVSINLTTGKVSRAK